MTERKFTVTRKYEVTTEIIMELDDDIQDIDDVSDVVMDAWFQTENSDVNDDDWEFEVQEIK